MVVRVAALLTLLAGAHSRLDINCQIFDATMVCDNDKGLVKRGEIRTCSG